MIIEKGQQSTLQIRTIFKITGIIGSLWALLVVFSATLVYLPAHPDFSFFTTYLSDIGDTPVWSQIFFNAGTLLSVPIRFLIIILFVLRLEQLGVGKIFTIVTVFLGLVTSAGTVLMTAVPYSLAPSVHKSGIPLYFLGVVFMQALVGAREWSLKGVSKILPGLSFLQVILYLVFAGLMLLYEQGSVDRNTPVVWEWLCFATSIFWLLGHSLILGNPINQRQGDERMLSNT